MVTKLIEQFFSAYSLRDYKRGETLLLPDTTLTHIIYLSEGIVKQYDIAPSGEQVILNTYKSGTFFPMSYAINPSPINYFFTAATPCKVRLAPVSEVLQFLNDNPSVLFDLLARVYRGTDGILSRLDDAMSGNASARVMREITIHAQRFGTIPTRKGAQFKHKLTTVQLAELTGLTRETVSRTITALKAQHVITWEKGIVTLLGQ